MIVADTSIWIEAERKPEGPVAGALRELVDADLLALALPVRLELVAGVARRNRKTLVRALTALPVLRPTDETWQRIERWVPMAADRGERFAVTDLLVAALAADIDALVWSLDDDFARMERLKMVRRHDV